MFMSCVRLDTLCTVRYMEGYYSVLSSDALFVASSYNCIEYTGYKQGFDFGGGGSICSLTPSCSLDILSQFLEISSPPANISHLL